MTFWRGAVQHNNSLVADFPKGERPTVLARESAHRRYGSVDHPVDEAHATGQRKHGLSYTVPGTWPNTRNIAGHNQGL